jgi:hypothetical protein
MTAQTMNPASMLPNLDAIGVYRDDRTGRLMRLIPRFKGFFREDGRPWESETDGLRYEGHDEIPVLCIVPPVGIDEVELHKMQRAAAMAGTDFYHPTLGWLRGGRKRELDHPENLGRGVVQNRRRYRLSPVPIEPAPVPVIVADAALAVDVTPAANPTAEAEPTDPPSGGDGQPITRLRKGGN